MNNIKLLPFTNQVGGHTSLFRFSKRIICKPMNERKEQEFYIYLKNHHPELLPFLSNYLGILNVTYYPEEFSLPEVIFEDNKQLFHELIEQNSLTDNMDYYQYDNQWSQKIYEKDRKKFKQFNNILKEFILLEDLTTNIEYPCVLDLKMGTRQYSVSSTYEKKKSQMKKANESTSFKLGVRICGMQIYDKDMNEFVFHDKYLGRKLNENEFKQHLELFLQGNQVKFIPILLYKLNRLKSILNTLKNYRFYGSSLLLIYDAKNTHSIDIRMIDFEKSVSPIQDFSSFKYPPQHIDEPDLGYILGLNTLIDYFSKIYHQ